MFFFVVALAFVACGSKNQSGAENSTESSRSETVIEASPAKSADLWTEEAVSDRVIEIYDKVNSLFSQQTVNLFTLDSLFCSKDYKELYAQVRKAEEEKSFEELCFIEYQPWDLGLVTPIKVSNIRPSLLTGDQAEVYFDLTDANGEFSFTTGFTLYLEDGAWMVHDFIGSPDDPSSIWEHMAEYVENNKQK